MSKEGNGKKRERKRREAKEREKSDWEKEGNGKKKKQRKYIHAALLSSRFPLSWYNSKSKKASK